MPSLVVRPSGVVGGSPSTSAVPLAPRTRHPAWGDHRWPRRVDAALQVAESSLDRTYTSELWRLKGELLVTQ